MRLRDQRELDNQPNNLGLARGSSFAVNPGEQALTVVMPDVQGLCDLFRRQTIREQRGARAFGCNSIIRPELRHIRGNRSGPSVYVANNSRRELHGILVRHNRFFAVPTATFRILFVFVALSHERRRVMHFGVTEQKLQDAVNDRLGISVARENA